MIFFAPVRMSRDPSRGAPFRGGRPAFANVDKTDTAFLATVVAKF